MKNFNYALAAWLIHRGNFAENTRLNYIHEIPTWNDVAHTLKRSFGNRLWETLLSSARVAKRNDTKRNIVTNKKRSWQFLQRTIRIDEGKQLSTRNCKTPKKFWRETSTSFHEAEESNKRVKTCHSFRGSANHAKCLPIHVPASVYTFARANIIHTCTISRTNVHVHRIYTHVYLRKYLHAWCVPYKRVGRYFGPNLHYPTRERERERERDS